MTPERLTGLAALLIDLRDWVADVDPGSLDYWLIDALIDVLARRRTALLMEGAR